MAQVIRDPLSTSVPKPKETKKSKLRSKARQEFVHSVSMAGLIELYYAPNVLIRWMWILSLFTCFVSITYHLIILIIDYKNLTPTYEFIVIDKQIVPFPKITVCIPTGINKTWAIEQIRFPPREKKMFDKLDRKRQDEFMDAMAQLIFHDGNQYVLEKSLRPSSPHYFAFHHVIIETFKQFPGGQSHFVKSGLMVDCKNIISNCQFGGKSYDCCENAPLQADDGGPCYDLGIDKMDQLLHRPRSPASPISFTFDLLTDWKHVLSYATINGYLIHIGNPFTMFGQPIAVQAGTHAMIDISQPKLQIDKTRCINEHIETIFGEYDSQGYLCKESRYGALVTWPIMQCGFPYGASFPNETEACTGAWGMPIKMILALGLADNLKKIEENHQNILYDIINSKTDCLPLCTRWEYSPRPSYSELVNNNYTTPIGDKNSANISRSQVTVYIGSNYYMQQREEKAKSFYDTFILIAYVMSLYVGFSVITLAEIVFYGCNLCRVYRKTGDKKNRVGPG